MSNPQRIADKTQVTEDVRREVEAALSALHMDFEVKDPDGEFLVDRFTWAEHAAQHLRAILR